MKVIRVLKSRWNNESKTFSNILHKPQTELKKSVIKIKCEKVICLLQPI